MKGTPFYTGEYSEREGPAADRVNLWPLLYYRNPALSVLWPIMESSPDHLAIRPIYSVYDRDKDAPVYNVLWPISRFDTAKQEYRIFPAYWGEDYFTLFPLYWHRGDPFSGMGYNALFPLWVWNRDAEGYGLDLFWPLYSKQKGPDRMDWRLWPLAGARQEGESYYGYYAWPLVHRWNNTNSTGHAVVPLYYYDQSDERTVFASIPYGKSITSVAGERSWDYLLPLRFRRWMGHNYHWESYPLLSWGWRNEARRDSWYVLGLGRSMRSEDDRAHHIFPLYYFSENAWGRSIYTLPWWSRSTADGSGWNTLFPLYHSRRSDAGSAFYSLPWLANRRTDASGWHASIPFYFRSYSEHSSAFYSLPWWAEEHADGSGWAASFPFYFNTHSEEASVLMTPLYARKKWADGEVAWRCFIPWVYMDETKDAHFLTPLGGRWRLGDQKSWLALPLLSGGSKDADSGRNVWLGGLAGKHWLGSEVSHYAFPFYYAAPYAGAFVSLPYTKWESGERKSHALPLFLSGWYSGAEESGALIAGGLAGYKRSEQHDYSYLFPLYYASGDTGTFLSLPYARWETAHQQNHLVLPLLSGWYRGEKSGAFLAAGLIGVQDSAAHRFHYVFPFYYAEPDTGTFLSLPYAKWDVDGRKTAALPLLLSSRSTERDGSETVLLGGLARWAVERDAMSKSHLLPIYAWEREAYFYTALCGRDQNMTYYATPLVGRYEGDASGSWMVPLYRHRRDSSGSVKGRYLLLGYYDSNEQRSQHGFFGLYGVNRRERPWSKNHSSYGLLGLWNLNEQWLYKTVDNAEPKYYRKRKELFLVWNKTTTEQMEQEKKLETSSLLGLLYDTRHEQEGGATPNDYFRRRVLWRVYHHEKLNGDASTDIFPGITIDSYKNGYYKASMLWRLFRYERDPEKGSVKLDLLFIPFRR